MAKTLLEKLTENTDSEETTATVASGNENQTLSQLMQEMKSHLQDASNDLLQPRAEAVQNLLKKVLH
jgi:hypothetical protein